LVLSTLLHDIAMHLTPDGFIRLASGTWKTRRIAHLDHAAWPVLWERFRDEATHFTSQQNNNLFGRPNGVQCPDLDQNNWTPKQFKLIGEFIRRHHSRLAHEIALHGFPGRTGDKPISLPADLDDLRDLAGLVARSHGMPLQPCIEYLDKRYRNRVDPRDVHAVYLMALLRVADYLDLGPRRAPKDRLRVQALRSPESLLEFKKNNVIKDLKQDSHNRHAIWCDIKTSDVEIWFRLRPFSMI